MTQSIELKEDLSTRYVLRIADSCLILSQRLTEWCGHGPVLEEDIALSNIALDLLGQSRLLLTHAARLDGQNYDEDQMAFLRDERDFNNITLVELPRGDFAFTVLRNFMFSALAMQLWAQLKQSSDAGLAAIAEKSMKETRYHHEHSRDWLIRLGDGTAESAAKMQAALELAWPYVKEIFTDDAIDAHAAQTGLGPRWSSLRDGWQKDMDDALAEAGLQQPKETPFLSTGKTGVHSEHMGFILAEMQHLQRAFPGATW